MMHLRRYLFVSLSVIVLILVFVTVRMDTCESLMMETPFDFVVTAFDDEEEEVLGRVDVQDSCRVGDVRYHLVEYEGEQFITYMSGIGPEESTRTTEQTLASFNVALLVFSGIAGALDANLSLGETVVVETWYDSEGGEPITIEREYIDKVAQEGVRSVEAGITVAYFATDTRAFPSHIYIVDMETYHVATVARTHAVPFVAFRSVSDFVDGSLEDEHVARAAGNSAEVALRFVLHN